MINCNLQRLDGPVRGNGKIVQELEGFFRGAGWNVIKVLWGREWDKLFAADTDGELVRIMNETPDGDFQTYKGESGGYVRENFFGKSPATKAMVDDMTDDEIWQLKRGGHDYRKVYAAYQAATSRTGKPTVVLAMTVKGYGLGHQLRGPQRHPPDEEADRSRPQAVPGPAADPGLGQGDRGRRVRTPVLPPGRGRARDHLPAGAPAPARRLRAGAAQQARRGEPAGGQDVRGLAGRGRASRWRRRPWPSSGCSGT